MLREAEVLEEDRGIKVTTDKARQAAIGTRQNLPLHYWSSIGRSLVLLDFHCSYFDAHSTCHSQAEECM